MENSTQKSFAENDILTVLVPAFKNPNPKLFHRDSNGTYHEIEKNELVHEICFSKDETGSLHIYHRFSHPKRGTIIDKTKDSELREKFAKTLFVPVVNNTLMEGCSMAPTRLNIREKFAHNESQTSYFVLCNYTMNRYVFSVIDGEIKRTDGIVEDKWYAFTVNSGRFSSDEERPEYTDYLDASFYEKAKVEGQDSTPFSKFYCLSDEEQKQVAALIDDFKKKLEALNVRAYYDNDYGKFLFIRNPPKNFVYEIYGGGSVGPSDVQIPFGAFYKGDVHMSYLGECDVLKAVYKPPKEASVSDD